jgi:S1-C subfamily serine protease
VNLFEKARASVVYISTPARVVDAWTRNVFNVPRGTGSRFIWDFIGHIVTSRHVVAGATGGARVRLSDGRDVDATLAGRQRRARSRGADSESGETAGAAAARHQLGPACGQSTFAIGNPFALDWTLTTGIVSALDRSLPTQDGGSLIEHLIQTDAAINPGNSGGPLLDSAGRIAERAHCEVYETNDITNQMRH